MRNLEDQRRHMEVLIGDAFRNGHSPQEAARFASVDCMGSIEKQLGFAGTSWNAIAAPINAVTEITHNGIMDLQGRASVALGMPLKGGR